MVDSTLVKDIIENIYPVTIFNIQTVGLAVLEATSLNSAFIIVHDSKQVHSRIFGIVLSALYKLNAI